MPGIVHGNADHRGMRPATALGDGMQAQVADHLAVGFRDQHMIARRRIRQPFFPHLQRGVRHLQGARLRARLRHDVANGFVIGRGSIARTVIFIVSN